MAKSLGKTKDYDYFMERSPNWKNLYDPQTGWIRPKNMQGKFKEPFDLYQCENRFVRDECRFRNTPYC
jgi:putative alpha-1,2-mannosidase